MRVGVSLAPGRCLLPARMIVYQRTGCQNSQRGGAGIVAMLVCTKKFFNSAMNAGEQCGRHTFHAPNVKGLRAKQCRIGAGFAV